MIAWHFVGRREGSLRLTLTLMLSLLCFLQADSGQGGTNGKQGLLGGTGPLKAVLELPGNAQ